MRRITNNVFRIGAAVALLLTSAASLPPKDECAAEPGFAAFRAELQRVIAARDDKKIMTLITPDILNGFSSDDGHVWFRKNWDLDNDPKNSALWSKLGKVLSMGCAKGDGWLAVPYLYQRIPDTYEPFDVVVATGPAIVMRDAPRADAKPVRTLDWEIVNAVGDEGIPDDWIKLRTDDGATGFALRDDVHSPIDYRALFKREKGKWMMTALLAGD